MSRLLAVLGLLGFCALPAAAQTLPPVALPDSIVVTALREPVEARQTGRRVTVLTTADIAALPAASFDELLRTAAGVEVFSRGAMGVQSDLTLRGSTFGGVLVLIDGVRFNDPMTGHFLSDFPLPLSEIARIEVLRGPASALYGPDAVGGVIQVFTFTGLGGTPPGGTIQMEGGSHALAQAEGAARFGNGATRWSVGGAYGRSDGHEIVNLDSTVGPLRAGFERGAATAAFHHRQGRAQITGRAAFDARAFDAVRFYTPFPSDTAREATETYWAHLGLTTDPARATRFTAQIGTRAHRDRYVYNPATPANEHTSRQATALVALHQTLPSGIVATTGVTALLRDIDSNNLGQHGDASAGVYAGLRAHPLPGFTASGSLRLDHDPGYGTEITPQGALAFSIENLTFRAAAGRSVRAPTYVERYFNTRLARPRGRDYGNPDLEAERSWTAEVGADAYLDGLALHATVFTRRVDNLIDFVKLTPADTVFRAQNLLEVRTDGLELEADGSLDLGVARLRLNGAYTYLDAAIENLGPGVQAKYALTNARHLGQLAAALDAGHVTVGVQSLVKQPLDGAAYSVHNLRAACTLPLAVARVQLSTEVRNVFDTRYTEVFAAMPGRWLLFGARVAW